MAISPAEIAIPTVRLRLTSPASRLTYLLTPHHVYRRHRPQSPSYHGKLVVSYIMLIYNFFIRCEHGFAWTCNKAPIASNWDTTRRRQERNPTGKVGRGGDAPTATMEDREHGTDISCPSTPACLPLRCAPAPPLVPHLPILTRGRSTTKEVLGAAIRQRQPWQRTWRRRRGLDRGRVGLTTL